MDEKEEVRLVFFRETTVKRSGKIYRYLMLVESTRCGRNVTQRTVASLGNLDRFPQDRINGLLRSLARFSEDLTVVPRNTGSQQ